MIFVVVLAVVLGTGTYSIWIMNGHISLAALSMIDHRSITAAPCPIVYIRTSNYIIAKHECKCFFEKN